MLRSPRQNASRVPREGMGTNDGQGGAPKKYDLKVPEKEISNHNYASSSCKKSLLYLCLSALVLVTAERLNLKSDLRVPIMSRKI